MKPFSTIAGVLFLVAAAVHAYRLFVNHFAVSIAGHAIPLNWSWGFLVIGGLLGIAVLSEARR